MEHPEYIILGILVIFSLVAIGVGIKSIIGESKFKSNDRAPDVSLMWGIDEIIEPVGFLKFVLSHAKTSDVWKCTEVNFSSESDHFPGFEDILHKGTILVQLSEENMPRVEFLVDQMDFDRAPFYQHIKGESGQLLYMIDWLSCCWVSKRITPEIMSSAVDMGLITWSDLEEEED